LHRYKTLALSPTTGELRNFIENKALPIVRQTNCRPAHLAPSPSKRLAVSGIAERLKPNDFSQRRRPPIIPVGGQSVLIAQDPQLEKRAVIATL
jgi:hypothetical protein